jgi:4-amino-4-deoxy-L-arabinose transferase-like glycosyltransferase
MTRIRARLVIVAIAAMHAALFIRYQQPDWNTLWTDQNGYMRLGHVLAGTGRFTRFPDHPQFVPEAIRTPGYPAFLAALDLAFGQSHLVIAVAQAVLFAAVCLLVFAIGRMVASDGVAFAAGLIAALYPPLPYFGALALTEVFTTFLVSLGMLLWLVGWRQRATGRLILSGAIFAWTALTRPTFQYFPVFLVAAAWLSAPRPERAHRIRGGLAMIAAFVAVLTPWLAYNAVHFRMLIFTPAGGIGRVLFEGTWQVALPGRVEAALTDMADKTGDRASLDAKVRVLAAESHLPAEPMLQYVHQWQDIRKIWTEPQDPWDRTVARIVADREYLRVGLANVREHPVRHLWRRATRGPVLLWATEIPVRYSDINALPPLAVRAIWAPQVVLMGLAAWGLMVLWRRGRRTEAGAFAALLLYITAVHTPLYTEARYSLPAKPVVLLLAVVAVAEGLPRRLSRRQPERTPEVTAGAPSR